MTSTISETPSFRSSDPPAPHLTPPMPPLLDCDSTTIVPMPPLVQVDSSTIVPPVLASKPPPPSTPAVATTKSASAHAPDPPAAHTSLDDIEDYATVPIGIDKSDAQFASASTTPAWPINTIAMLDGEKRVCLPCEGLTISETIDGYVWLIESVAAMAPGRKLCDVKFIIGDGIFASETLLSKLCIHDTCHLILDHHHLLSARTLELGPKHLD
ncbi:hypothetical protein IV203_037168 [Nitzschia inconspicua]|uniref:Uncharacterized protein n=1 Tax=Nitzschia inconspicua TaxID=303405 RepID=A0A9K3LNE7_9STRA|nr:hypothetical protein IV203_037168 [Nitzschia inconspicua]